MKLIELVHASKLAYLTEPEIKKYYPMCDFVSQDETQLFIDENDERILIAFRGTQGNIEDWMANLDFTKTVDMHRGFNDALNKVWQTIKLYICYNKPFYITGHSLGAALAGLCAFRLSIMGIQKLNVYTFGQPRMGGNEFSEKYNELLKASTYRFVNNNDIITRVPPRSLNYSHVGKLEYFKEDGTLTQDISEWDRFLDRINGRIQDIGEWGTDGIKDHSIDEYVRLIRDYN